MAIIQITEVGLGMMTSQTFLSGALSNNCIEVADADTVAQIQGIAGILGSSAGEMGVPLSVSTVQLMLERSPTIWGIDTVARDMQRLPTALFQSAAKKTEYLLRTAPILEDRETTRDSLIRCIEAERRLHEGKIEGDPFNQSAEIYVAPVVGMVLDNIISHHPSDWSSLVVSAVEAYRDKTIDALVENDLATAERHFGDLLQRVSLQEKDHASALFEVGKWFLKKKGFREAELALMKSLAIDDTLPKTWLHLAYVFRENLKEIEMRKWENMKTAVDKALQLECEVNPQTHFLKGLILFEMGSKVLAEVSFTQALHLEKTHPSPRDITLSSLAKDIRSGTPPIHIWRVVFDVPA